jgi:hypothetical protein
VKIRVKIRHKLLLYNLATHSIILSHVSGVTWLIIVDSRFDDWIYLTPLSQLNSIITVHTLNSFWITNPSLLSATCTTGLLEFSRILVTLPLLVPCYNCWAAVLADTASKGVTLRISLLWSRYCASYNSLLWLSAFNSETVNRCVVMGAYSYSAWVYIYPAVGWQWTPGSDFDNPAFRPRVKVLKIIHEARFVINKLWII